MRNENESVPNPPHMPFALLDAECGKSQKDEGKFPSETSSTIHIHTYTVLRLRGFVQAYRRMSIAVNASTVNPHYWYRQSPPGLPSWYTYSSTTFRNHKVFQLRFLIQSDVRCNDGTRAGLVTFFEIIVPAVRAELTVGSKPS
ncbi:hypothetical protein TSMEX_001007 [Taenia solium]|eukprot:TsM_000573900 transcript=TsM_000573900 gene=TsM_000573900